MVVKLLGEQHCRVVIVIASSICARLSSSHGNPAVDGLFTHHFLMNHLRMNLLRHLMSLGGGVKLLIGNRPDLLNKIG